MRFETASRTDIGRSGKGRNEDAVGLHIPVDHSEVQEMVQRGLITAEQAEVASNRNIITRVVGTDPNVEVDLFDVPLTPRDTVLLCSDGLVTAVTDAEIADVLQYGLLGAAVDRLVELAKGPKGHDNVTVGAARLFL